MMRKQKIEEIIVLSKEKFCCNKLVSKPNNPNAQLNHMSLCLNPWSMLKTMVNRRRVPLIPPIQIGQKFIINYTEKSRAFNNYFAKQCRLVDKNSQIIDRTNLLMQTSSYLVQIFCKLYKKIKIIKAYGQLIFLSLSIISTA